MFCRAFTTFSFILLFLIFFDQESSGSQEYFIRSSSFSIRFAIFSRDQKCLLVASQFVLFFFLSSILFFVLIFSFSFLPFSSQFNPSVRKGERFPRLRSHDCLSNNYCNTVVGDYFIPNDYCELRSTDYFFSIPGIHPTEG